MSIGSGAAAGAAIGGPAGALIGGVGGLLFGGGPDPSTGGFGGSRYGGNGSDGGGGGGGGGGMGGTPDPRGNAFQWGGAPGMAAADQGYDRQQAEKYGNMTAPGLDYQNADQMRNRQYDALGMMQGAAMGNAPSQAAIMMRQGNDQAIANQMAMAAGARGAGAMAGAQQQAMGNASNMSTQNQNNMGALRAQEMANARQAYFGGASGARSMDEARAQNEGQLGLGYRQLGLQGQLGFEGQRFNVGQAQMGGQMGMYGADQAKWQAQMQNDQQSRQASDKNALGWGELAMKGAQGVGA